ncbi:MAG: restriction endonuclease subunit S [Candidatus Pacebacteria bacterium]|nr:restriction endonuclease subunit S [Candidatus Paceibacterota bacterium]
MIKAVTINKAIIEKEKWTPKFAYIYKKLETSPKAIELKNFIYEGPTNGVDLRNFIDEGRNYIRISDMRRFFISYSDIRKVELDKIPKKAQLQENDILISRKGTPGISVITTSQDLNNVIGTEVILLRIKKEYSPYYLVAFFNSKVFFEQVVNNLSGAVSSGINHPSLKKLKILYDENLIKNISDKVKKTMSLQVKSSELLDIAKNIYYQKLGVDFLGIKKETFYSVNLSNFSSVDLWSPTYSYPLYVNTIKAIQKKCRTVPLGEITTVKKGDEVGSDNYNKYLDKRGDDISFIRTSDLVNYEVDPLSDFYIPEEIYKELKQDIKINDILFTKDGKIGMTAMITKNDKMIICSGVSRLRLKAEAKKYNLTSEYIFLILSLKETGLYPSIRRTVIASTLPHLREERLKEFEIPVLEKDSIDEITKLIKEAFELKDEKKKLIKEIREEIDNYFEI